MNQIGVSRLIALPTAAKEITAICFEKLVCKMP